MLATIAARDAALRVSQSLLTNIADKSSAVIYVKDLEGRYLMVNQRLRQVLPAGSVDPIGHRDADLFDERTVAVIRDGDRMALASPNSYIYEEAVPNAEGELRTYISENSACATRQATSGPWAASRPIFPTARRARWS